MHENFSLRDNFCVRGKLSAKELVRKPDDVLLMWRMENE